VSGRSGFGLEATQRCGRTANRIGFIDTVRWLLRATPEELANLLVNRRRPGRHDMMGTELWHGSVLLGSSAGWKRRLPIGCR